MLKSFRGLGIVALATLAAAACFDSSKSKAPTEERMQVVEAAVGEGPWGIKGFEKSLLPDGEYLGHSADSILFNNGERIAHIGYKVSWLRGLPSMDAPKIHLFMASDCWACDHYTNELIAVSVPSKKIERLPFPGRTIHTVDPVNEESWVEQSRRVVLLGKCGPYVAVGSAETRAEKSAPWKFETTWGISLTSSGDMEVTKPAADDPLTRKLRALIATPPTDCENLVGFDNYKYK